MKTTTRTNIYLPMAALILTAALAVPAAAQQRVPFKGTFQGNDAITPGPGATTVVISTTATGIGTLFGQFSFIQEITADLDELHSHRVGSLDRRQWRQHLYDSCRNGGTVG